jgi:hypothetical protein
MDAFLVLEEEKRYGNRHVAGRPENRYQPVGQIY